MYPRLFPFAMLNIMQHGKKFLKAMDLTLGDSSHNGVRIESNGMIDPYLPWSRLGSLFPDFPNRLQLCYVITKWS